MKVRKRLLVILMMALAMVAATAGMAYAADPISHTPDHNSSDCPRYVTTDSAQSVYMECWTSECEYWSGFNIGLSVDDIVYNGSTHAATKNYGGRTGISFGTIYYEGRNGTSYGSTTAPKAVGDYKAYADVSIRGEGGGWRVWTDFSITPRTINVQWGSTTEFTYNGQEQAPSVSIPTDAVMSGDQVSVAATGESEVGTHTATAVLSGRDADNYVISEGTLNKEFKITPKAVRIVFDPRVLTYNGDVQTPEATVNQEDLVSGDSCDVTQIETFSDATCETPAESKDVGVYYAKATALSSDNYVINPDYDKTSFEIVPAEVSIKFADNSFVYDGEIHQPTVEIIGVFSGDDCEPDVQITGSKTSKVEDEDKDVAIHAGTYNAVVERDDTVDPPTTGLIGKQAKNYKLKKSKYSYQFKIEPKEVELLWYQYKYDKYGELVNGTADPEKGEVQDGAYILVPVEEGLPKLVFNGKKQTPKAGIIPEELETPVDTKTLDTCEVTVEGDNNAVEVETYTVRDINFSNPDYTRDQKGTKYEIVPRPVKLRWYVGDSAAPDAEIPFAGDEDKPSMSVTYNGEEQEPIAEVTNLQTSNRGETFDCDVTVGCTSMKHWENDGHHTGYPEDIDTDRQYIDAGIYEIYTAELSDPYNYSLCLLDPETNTITDKKVAHWEVTHKIDQYQVGALVWTGLKKTYNACWQEPSVKMDDENLQGPDKQQECTVIAYLMVEDGEDLIPPINAGTYGFEAGKLSYEGDVNRSMNYKIGEGTSPLFNEMVIAKAPLTVTAIDRYILYGDKPNNAGVFYTGLKNGKSIPEYAKKYDLGETPFNTDMVNGKPDKYKNNEGETVPVVNGTIKYTYTYAQYGKPGKYKINISGLSADNYDINYKSGTLTVNDKFTALVAKAKAGSKKGTLYWNGVTGAAKYDIYYAHCNTKKKTYTPKYYKTVGGNKTSTKIKKLKKRNFYKFYVVALDSSGKQIAQSELSHFCTGNVSGKYTNPKSIKASATNVTVSKGGTFKLSAKVKKVKKGKKLVNGIHTSKIRYKSEVPAVATVTPDGTITGVGTGWCRLYVLAANGIWQTVEVNVQ